MRPSGAGLVNAVLRRAVREARPLIDALLGRDAGPGRAAPLAPGVDHAAVVARARRQATRELMAANNEPAEAALRANTLRITAAELAARLPVATREVEQLPEALVLDAPFDTSSAPEWRDGLLMPQSRAAMAVARALAPAARASACSTCAPRPAARRPTSPR